jgi:hypothetical protein
MDHVSSCSKTTDHLLLNAPFADERKRYLRYCAANGARPEVLMILETIASLSDDPCVSLPVVAG